MKKLLLLAAVVLIAASCEKQNGDELYMYSQEFEVKSQHWEPYDDGSIGYYYYTFDMPRLTRKVCEIGEVSATCYVNNNVQSQLPEVLHRNDGTNAWTETIRYQYEPGKITFIVSYSDYYYFETQRPPGLAFRVVLNY